MSAKVFKATYMSNINSDDMCKLQNEWYSHSLKQQKIKATFKYYCIHGFPLHLEFFSEDYIVCKC